MKHSTIIPLMVSGLLFIASAAWAQNNLPVLAPIGPQTLNEGATLNLRVTATDPDPGDIISLVAESAPLGATFSDSSGGVGGFVFAPDFTQSGLYQVRFIASDGNGGADSEMVAITVTNIDRAPLLAAIGPQSIAEGAILNIRISATDPDGDAITLIAEQIPTNGAFIDSTGGRGGLSFTPDYTQSGLYQVRFIAQSGVLADTELVDITVTNVNQAPVITPIGLQSVAEGATLNVRVSATDPDGDIITLLAEQAPANGVFADSSGGIGGLVFNPDYTQAGLYQVRFIAQSGSLADTELVDITVTNTDRAPLISPAPAQFVIEGGHLAVRISAADADGDPITLSAEQLPINAVFADSTGGVGGLTFDPDFSQSGIYQIRIIAAANARADTEMVQITVTETNLPPVLSPIGSQVVDEGATLNVTLTASDPDGSTPGFLAYNLPANSNLTDHLNGSAAFTFSPNYNQAGVHTVLFVVADGALADSEYVQITVNNVNQAPILGTIGAQTVSEGNLLQFGVMSFDPDGNLPSLTAGPLPANATFLDNGDGTGTFNFAPDFTQEGVYNVLFIATDGALADSESAPITVVTTNQAPVFDPLSNQAVLEGTVLDFTIHAVDPDGGIPSLAAQNLLVNSTFTDNGDGAGAFHYTPDYTQSGVDIVRFIASDGAAADTLDIQITTVEAGNQRPVLNPIGARNVNEGAQLQFDISASDLDGALPQLAAENLPVNATFTDHLNGVGTFTFNPDHFQAGQYLVLFYAADGALADSEYVLIDVANVPRAPILNAIGPQSVGEGGLLSLNISASDPDGNPLTLAATPLAPNMTMTDNGDGAASFAFSPSYVQGGVYYVTFIAADSILADSEQVQITVIDAGNQAPVLAPIDTAYYVTEGNTISFPISASDLDLNPLALSADPLVTNMSFTDNSDGTGLFAFTPGFAQSGYYHVTFRAFDGIAYDSATVAIYVAEAGNQYPIMAPIGPQSVAEGSVLTIDVSASDPEGYTPFLFVDNPPPSAVFIDNHNGTGRLVYSADYYSAGVHTLRFIAMDVGGLTDYEDVDITVTDVNQPPVIAFYGDTLVAEGAALTATVRSVDSTDFQPGTLSLLHGYLPPNATFTITGNGIGQFVFQPDYNQAGVDSAYFVTVDSDNPPLSASRWIRFTVRNINRRPVLQQAPPTEIDQGDTLALNITATDPDGDPVTLYINSYSNPPLPPNAEFQDLGGGHGIFTFHPDYTQSGIFVINFAATDGLLNDIRPGLIQVHDLGNQRPILNPIGPLTVTEGDSLVTRISAADPDNTPPALAVQNGPAGLALIDSLNGAGSLQYLALYNQAGVYNLVVLAADGGGLADSETVVLTVVEAGNQYPILGQISNRSVSEGNTLQFSVLASDPDSTMPHLVTHNLPANASFADSSNGRGGFVFQPDFTQAGAYQIMFVAVDSQDSALADSQQVTITVTDFNRRPVIDPLGPYTINEGENLNFTIVAHDPDSTIPLIAAGHIPPNATFVDNGDGTGLFNLDASFFQAGVDSARFFAMDQVDHGLFTSMTVRITIVNVNRPPVLAPIPDTTIGDGFQLVLSIVAADPDSTFPILFQRGKPDSARFVDNGNGTGSLTWRPLFSDIGNYHFVIGCRDRSDQSVSDSQFVNIEVVTTGNHPPIFVQIPDQQLGDDDTLSLRLTASDIDGDPLTIAPVGILPFGMIFADSGNGVASVYWIPAPNQSGDTVATLVARDPGGLTDTLQFHVLVITFVRGDANGNGVLNGLDVIYLVNYFKGGPAPIPLEAGDANGNGVVNGLDVIYLINYFKGGPPPPPMPPAGGGKILLKSHAAPISSSM